MLRYDDFDDGTLGSWKGYRGEILIESYLYYRSWPNCARLYGNSIHGSGCFEIDVDTTGPYTEAYLIYSIQFDSGTRPSVDVNYTKTFEADQQASSNVWYRFAIPLPLSLVTNVRILAAGNQRNGYLDDAYVIAK